MKSPELHEVFSCFTIFAVVFLKKGEPPFEMSNFVKPRFQNVDYFLILAR